MRGHLPGLLDYLPGECHWGCHPDPGEDLVGLGLPVPDPGEDWAGWDLLARELAGLPGDGGEHHRPMVPDRPGVLLLGLLGEGSWEITQ